MDSFFASVEQRDFPEYRGKPLVVGRRGPRSVVAAASYEARKYGIHSAMPMVTALKKCPHLIVAGHHFQKYKDISQQINDIFHEYTDLVEPLSLDEAFLDVTEPKKKGIASGSLIAQEIRRKVFKQTQLTASAGVSYNKFLAKIASDMDKPDGFFLIKPENAEKFLEELEIRKFFGVGKKTQEKMQRMGIFHGRDLKKLSIEELTKHFGKPGKYFYFVVRGIDERPVMPHRERKSIGAERTFREDIYDTKILKEKLDAIIDEVWRRCQAKNKAGKTLTVKVRYSNFTTITRSSTHLKEFTDYDMHMMSKKLIPMDEMRKRGVRLLGISMSNFESEEEDFLNGQLEIDFDWDNISQL
jgi:DNA polymerase-4